MIRGDEADFYGLASIPGEVQDTTEYETESMTSDPLGYLCRIDGVSEDIALDALSKAEGDLGSAREFLTSTAIDEGDDDGSPKRTGFAKKE